MKKSATQVIDSIVNMGTQCVDHAADLALFLQEMTGSVCGFWHGHMRAADQRALFGRYLGRGTICIDGAREMLYMSVSVDFGRDYDERKLTAFRDLHQYADA